MLSSMRASFTPTGGFFYHYSAWRYNRSLWGPFRHKLNGWLKRWNPQQKNLVLVGASGGYSLNEDFLSRFDNLTCIDPDPLARLLFKRRFSDLSVHWVEHDYFRLDTSSPQPHGWKQISNDFSDHAILICNFLGQAPLLLAKQFKNETFNKQYVEWKTYLNLALENRSWASYHDLYSASKPERTSAPTVIDHLTADLFIRYRSKEQFMWHRLPTEVHLIEALYS
ncbi:MAG: hypothetical protein H6626_07900 [Pseudobdellovibrionaceae bacterium]|nr:MAG: hypothetical protein H6626_07900 [Pseudobdellovibrionaceae bacterium]